MTLSTRRLGAFITSATTSSRVWWRSDSPLAFMEDGVMVVAFASALVSSLWLGRHMVYMRGRSLRGMTLERFQQSDP